MTRKVIKGSVIADLLAENPINDYEALDFKFLDEYINVVGDDAEGPDDVWEMYFDGAVNLSGNGIRAVLVAPDGKHFPIAVKLRFYCTSNVAEYEACINVSPHQLYNLISPWPFAMWGIDVIGPINQKASNGHRFILVAIDYFTKWVKATSYAHITQKTFLKFLKNNIICWYGLLGEIVTDNAKNLNGPKIQKLCD
ncbi:uncharacterized protein LOC131180132 [Hevea brasiliensis]|uniref:uncharacterized protein LOC131180132 n=1 Tax=Hevea brasiliensis TaxID=3981 RepID=UPI002600A1B6|nr:uncharacterized protein LOC131180132 [Hevea brasiliensis]